MWKFILTYMPCTFSLAYMAFTIFISTFSLCPTSIVYCFLISSEWDQFLPAHLWCHKCAFSELPTARPPRLDPTHPMLNFVWAQQIFWSEGQVMCHSVFSLLVISLERNWKAKLFNAQSMHHLGSLMLTVVGKISLWPAYINDKY